MDGWVGDGKCASSGSYSLQVDADGTYHLGSCFDTSSCGPRCASPDTLVATPEGERQIDELSPGDSVYSSDGNGIVVVPVARKVRVPVAQHHVMRLELDNGRVLEMSAGHPTADGRTLGSLRAGDVLGGPHVRAIERIEYRHPYTVDILPASATGSYVAAGALVGSTLFSAPADPPVAQTKTVINSPP